MKELSVQSLYIEDINEPRDKETYLCLTSSGKLFICDYGHTYNFLMMKSKRKVFKSLVRPNMEIKDIIAIMSVYELHNGIADIISKEI